MTAARRASEAEPGALTPGQVPSSASVQAGSSSESKNREPDPVISATQNGVHPFGGERSRAWAVAPLLVIAAVLWLYAYPFLHTTRELGPTPLPPLFTADTYLYFTLDRVVFSGTTITNPWYPLPVRGTDLGYLRFPGAIVALRAGERLIGSPARTLLAWTLFWVLACGLSGYWILRLVLPRAPALVAAFLALFLTVDLLRLPSVAAAWLHPHLAAFDMGLPFLRLLFPQTAIALVCAYLALQVKALKNSRGVWILMAVLQALEAVSFPYATLYMAMVTAVSVSYLYWKERRPALGSVAAYAIACGIIDVAAMVALGSLSAGPAGGDHISRLAAFATLIAGKKLWLVAALTIAAAFLEGTSVEVKALVLGCGIANCMLLMGDVVFPVGFQVSNHAMYFVHTTQAILLAYIAYAVLCRPRFTRFATPLAATLLVFSLLHGALVARATYEGKLSFNRYQAGALRALIMAHANSSDLVLAPAQYVDDTACWIPLMTGAQALFCRDAEMAMTFSQMQQFEPQRFFMYLYFRGADQEWLRRATATAQAAVDYSVARIPERLTLEESGDANGVLGTIRNQLSPGLAAMATGDPAAQETLRQARRVLVVDSVSGPVFVRERLEQYLDPIGEADTVVDGVAVRAYRARGTAAAPLPPK